MQLRVQAFCGQNTVALGNPCIICQHEADVRGWQPEGEPESGLRHKEPSGPEAAS